MISDAFPVTRRGVAMSIFQAGGVIGFSIGAMIGGAVTATYGWRQAMIGFGLFGLMVACLVKFAIGEPERRVAKDESGSGNDLPPIYDVLRFIRRQKSLVHFAIATVLIYFVEAITNFWTYSYFIRGHEMSIAEASVQISIVWLASGIPGTLLGGMIADRLSHIDMRGPVWMCAIIPLVMVLLSFPLYLSTSTTMALTMLFAYNFIYSMYYGLAYMGSDHRRSLNYESFRRDSTILRR